MGLSARALILRWRHWIMGYSFTADGKIMAENNYGRFTVGKLKDELAKRGARTTGRKEALIERLDAYDKNDNFRNPVIHLPEYTIPQWPSSGFRQLVSEHRSTLPKVDRCQIDGYFKYRMVSDHGMANDLKALQKGEKLMESDRVSACSLCEIDTCIYFTGIVAAAMKKKLTYNYKLSVEKSSGEIVNSHCECPAGKGPHGTCKHLAAVLLMLVKFIEDGQCKIKRSCTENLQSFHMPKRQYEGSPVKSENFPASKQPCLDDPRPSAHRNKPGFEADVRNRVYNYCSTEQTDLTVKFLYPKADILTAVKDHDYLMLPFTQYWVDSYFQIKEAEAIKLEAATRRQSLCLKWHDAREWRLTASRFGDVMHMTARRNIDKLCESICFPPVLSGPPVIHGLKFETVACKSFEEKTGFIVSKCGVFVHPSYPYLGATPDGVIDDNKIIEIKCPYTGRDLNIAPGK
ncbi:uncharacterized protein LOC126807882 [Patella vulgata]|uniref:uncharacterized protein LOC126807882 n=1 Tax=Patella vulgata TaxID=6465 RepID=UPI00217FB16D|nr:uncharacterized protein LOC126807882 [Patella vulgata]